MLKKQHGPSLKKKLIELKQCSACRGKAVVRGIFHEIDCDQCNASGWVSADTGEVLQLQDLVTQLSLRLQLAQLQITELNKLRASESEAHYQGNNRRGAGGSHYTGD